MTLTLNIIRNVIVHTGLVTDTKYPSEIRNISPYPSEKSQRSKDAESPNPYEFFSKLYP